MRFPQATPISTRFRFYFCNSVASCGNKLFRPATSLVKAYLLFVLNLPAGSYVYNEAPEECKESVMHLSCYPELLRGHDGSGEEYQRRVLQKTVCEEGSPEECLNLSMGISQWGKLSGKGTERSARIQKGMVWPSPAWSIHSHAACSRGEEGSRRLGME